MGGVIVMQAGNGGVEYIFTEKNFGQFASNEEVQCLSFCCGFAEVSASAEFPCQNIFTCPAQLLPASS